MDQFSHKILKTILTKSELSIAKLGFHCVAVNFQQH